MTPLRSEMLKIMIVTDVSYDTSDYTIANNRPVSIIVIAQKQPFHVGFVMWY